MGAHLIVSERNKALWARLRTNLAGTLVYIPIADHTHNPRNAMRHGLSQDAYCCTAARACQGPPGVARLPPAARTIRRDHAAHMCRSPPSEVPRSVGRARALQASESLSTESSSLWLSMLAIGKVRFLAELKIVGK